MKKMKMKESPSHPGVHNSLSASSFPAKYVIYLCLQAPQVGWLEVQTRTEWEVEEQ